MSITNWNVLLSSKRLSNHEIDLSSDYKRIITSPAFRRLQDKTQVFPLNRGDFVRTRLTHSLEVAAIAKTIATKASKEAKRLSNDDKNQWLSNLLDIQTVLECAALLHDIGNPPFGHFGETVIRSWFKDNKKRYELQERLTPQQLNDFLNSKAMLKH
ncbi:dNTP triphosphohydrolase [Moraxella sp. FZFQ2102]|uniref:dGTP triphosphohydrolase n=1 Tax=Moraxella sp. FZFQ2102 TaxID=2953752 RepID=UPI00209BC1FE|nr:dNTP triphosphohydrolase [Moraxella sp. FZFQ2102]USZ13956.1 dNTP triphosphohydrolase [Moraxella sp. FZFQ2102]